MRPTKGITPLLSQTAASRQPGRTPWQSQPKRQAVHEPTRPTTYRTLRPFSHTDRSPHTSRRFNARAITDETTRNDPLTSLVAAHQTANACGFPFHLLLADTRNEPPNHRTAHGDAGDVHTQAAARTYGLPHDLTPNQTAHQIDDIATTIEALNTPVAAHAARQPARSL